ncbi:hypothetical protein LZL87_012470 [Fusarium oxysporum]|nr:hypothetical protein LZL87_012470 [Fusarium oxysporum]
MMEQYPSTLVTSLGEPPKQRSIREERPLRVVDRWMWNVPGAVLGDSRRFYGLPEESEEEEDDKDNGEEEEEEEKKMCLFNASFAVEHKP